MALELSGEGRPLLGSPTSPADSQLHVRWSRLQALPPQPPLGSELPLEQQPPPPGKPPPPLGKPPAYSSMLSTDSGCESEGGVSDSVYSTVTSCTSDLVRLQLEPLPSDEEAEQEERAEAAATPPPPPAESTDSRRVRSWSLEARGAEVAAEPVICAAAETADLLPLRLALGSYSEPSLTTSASTASMPICRICHMPSEERAELISPCRCAGTMQYIHTACLMHWIEVSSRRSKRPPCCELCQYQYQRHKSFRVGRWVVPAVSTRDKVLHSVFIITAIVMITCAIITIFCFKQDSGKRRLMYDEAELTANETVTLVCGILFFAGFFVGMYCEVKAKYSMYHLVSRVFYLNQQWSIDEYDRAKDDKFRGLPPGGSAV